MKDTDFLFLTSMLRARETAMLKEAKIDRMLDAPAFDDAAKLLLECGYPDMSGMKMTELEGVLQKHRSDVFNELSSYKYAVDIVDLFRMKYDYHNVKVLVKSAGANADASYLLSESGSVGIKELTEAFISGQRGDLPPPIASAIESAAGILSRTGNPQLSDIEIDKVYFAELASLAERLDDEFITGYVRLMIDSANLRITVRAARVGRDEGFLSNTLIPGGNVSADVIVSSYSDSVLSAFTADALAQAVSLGGEAIAGGAQTLFELACDNAVLFYVTNTMFISFGPAPVIAYLAKLEWEITAVRMILTGKLTGISPNVIRERLRECHV